MDTETDVVDINEQIKVRKEKLSALRDKGNAYPNGVKREHLAQELLEQYGNTSKEDLSSENVPVVMAGRIVLRRLMGKASFVHIQDMSGKMQVYLRKDDLPEGVYDQFKEWDIGDIIAVSGTLFRTKTDELTVKAESAQLLSKALRPLPDKYHGLHDAETCYRQRYLDLMVNQDTREVFLTRTKIVQAIRDFLCERQYIEVETPMMQVIPGGATARPFKTYHNALDLPMYLRIAPELYLKRLVVGGFERVFEINRNFRNEGLSTRHNPEFTMLEFYEAYSDYKDLMALTEEMLPFVAQKAIGTTKVSIGDREFDFANTPYRKLTVEEAVRHYNPDLKTVDLRDKAVLIEAAQKLDIPLKDEYGAGKILLEIFEKTAEHKLFEPTFITHYPAEVSPLARKTDNDPFLTDRFEFFIGGREIANGFSELNDPEDQAARFKEQAKALSQGDEEAMHYDEDYITALEYGLPPTAGEGIGIDRLVMVLTGTSSIRDVILFPHLRPQAK